MGAQRLRRRARHDVRDRQHGQEGDSMADTNKGPEVAVMEDQDTKCSRCGCTTQRMPQLIAAGVLGEGECGVCIMPRPGESQEQYSARHRQICQISGRLDTYLVRMTPSGMVPYHPVPEE